MVSVGSQGPCRRVLRAGPRQPQRDDPQRDEAARIREQRGRGSDVAPRLRRPFSEKGGLQRRDRLSTRLRDWEVGAVSAGGPNDVEAIRRKPAMLAEGLRDRAILPEIAINHFRAAFPDGAVVELRDAGHFCQEDQPTLLVSLIEQFVQLT